MRIAVLAVVAALSVFGCGESNSTVSPSGAPGTLRLLIKDTPYSEAAAMLVTFSEVTAHRSGEGGFSPLPFAADAGGVVPTTRTCDLKQLVNTDDVLGVGTVPAGHYTQVRVVVSSAVLYSTATPAGTKCATTIPPPGPVIATLEIPNTEARLVRSFDIAAAPAVTTMLIDFDGDRSVVAMGNGRVRMTPVIGVVSVQ